MQVEQFSALFERFERSAFRVEARDRYDVDDEREELAVFLKGEDLPPRTAASSAWLRLVAASKDAGRQIERVRIVGEPLTDYTRFEFAAYRDNIAAGEKIRVLPRCALTDADQSWASEDFWIFDDELVVLLSYDDEGRFLGVRQPEDIRPVPAGQAASTEHRARLRRVRRRLRATRGTRLLAARGRLLAEGVELAALESESD